MSNHYNCSIYAIGETEPNLTAYDKDHLLFFTKHKLPKSMRYTPPKGKRKGKDLLKGVKVDDLFNNL